MRAAARIVTSQRRDLPLLLRRASFAALDGFPMLKQHCSNDPKEENK
jgi:hypothetical protein